MLLERFIAQNGYNNTSLRYLRIKTFEQSASIHMTAFGWCCFDRMCSETYFAADQFVQSTKRLAKTDGSFRVTPSCWGVICD